MVSGREALGQQSLSSARVQPAAAFSSLARRPVPHGSVSRRVQSRVARVTRHVAAGDRRVAPCPVPCTVARHVAAGDRRVTPLTDDVPVAATAGCCTAADRLSLSFDRLIAPYSGGPA